MVSEALRHDFLMDALLAFTAMHSATEAQHAADASTSLNEALHYQNRSLAQLGRVLESISRDNCDAVLLASLFNMICALLAPLIAVPPAANTHEENIADVMVRVRDYMVSVHSMTLQYLEWVLDGNLATLINDSSARRVGTESGFTCEKLHRLNNAVLAESELHGTVSAVSRSAIEYLEMVFAETNGRSVLRWVKMLPPEFFQELHRGESTAMVVLMCWGSVLYLLDEVWWTRYAGLKIVEDLSKRVKACEGDWAEVVTWCRQEVGLGDDV